MNNEPAFPSMRDIRNNPDFDHEEGMTLRDYFAAKAMQGLLAQSMGTALGSDPKNASEHAYAMADAMMKARRTE
jgi:hypothetical protein